MVFSWDCFVLSLLSIHEKWTIPVCTSLDPQACGCMYIGEWGLDSHAPRYSGPLSETAFSPSTHFIQKEC
jgi:hypothetical protein